MQEFEKEYKVNLGELVTQKTLEALFTKYKEKLPKYLSDKIYRSIEYVDEQIEYDKEFCNSNKYDISNIEFKAKFKYIDKIRSKKNGQV